MKLFFIDFDFVNYNYRSFDIANFFNELYFNYTISYTPYFEYKLDQD